MITLTTTTKKTLHSIQCRMVSAIATVNLLLFWDLFLSLFRLLFSRFFFVKNKWICVIFSLLPYKMLKHSLYSFPISRNMWMDLDSICHFQRVFSIRHAEKLPYVSFDIYSKNIWNFCVFFSVIFISLNTATNIFCHYFYSIQKIRRIAQYKENVWLKGKFCDFFFFCFFFIQFQWHLFGFSF